MRILHTSDWHLGKNLEGYTRIEEQETFLADFIKLVEERLVDLIVIAGDIYDNPNPSARAEKLFYDTLKKLSDHGKRIILVIAGNHDNPERLVAAGPLAREHGIIMVATPKSVVSCGKYGQHSVVESGEGYFEIEINGERSVILTVPYPSEKRLNEVLYGAMDREEDQLQSYSERIKMLFDSLSIHFREDTINLVVAHLFVMGSEESGSERNVQLGGSFIIDGKCLPQKAHYIALGHIHKPQIVPGTGKRARYAGSPLHYNKKEINFKKSCYIVDIKIAEENIVEEIPFKVYKPIEIWKCANIEEAIETCEQKKEEKCWVYLEITTDRYIREDEIKAMKSAKKDILEIVPIIKEKDINEREELQLSERSLEDMFREFYRRERSVEPQDDVVKLLLSVVGEEE